MNNNLFLFFPEWQGSGLTAELHAGACALRKACPSIPFQEVPVGVQAISEARFGILGYDPLLEQQRACRRLIEAEAPRRIFSLGGDCGIELAPVSWLNREYEGKLVVIWLDAHGDLNTPKSSASQHFHGMPLRFLLEKQPHPFSSVCFSRLTPAQVFLVGTRDLDAPESRFIHNAGIRLLGVDRIEVNPALLNRQLAALGLHEIYLHIDLDVLEPTAFPGVKCPAPGGLHLETLRLLIQSLQSEFQIVGCSIVEYVDGSDEAGPIAIRSLIQAAIGDWLL